MDQIEAAREVICYKKKNYKSYYRIVDGLKYF